MKKEYYLVIIFCSIFVLSYISAARGIQSQGDAFVYLSGMLLFFTVSKIALENLLLNYKESVIREIILMIGLYCSSFFVATFVMKFSIEKGIAFQLIVFGMILGAVGIKMHERIERKTRK